MPQMSQRNHSTPMSVSRNARQHYAPMKLETAKSLNFAQVSEPQVRDAFTGA
jgi:hypothetical protein